MEDLENAIANLQGPSGSSSFFGYGKVQDEVFQEGRSGSTSAELTEWDSRPSQLGWAVWKFFSRSGTILDTITCASILSPLTG